MASYDYSARPRYLPLTRNRRLEVDYLLDQPQRPVALTVVDRRGREVDCDDVVIALAWRLSRGRRRPRTIVGALRVLLDVAVARRRSHEDAERAARNLAQAEEHDAGTWVDEPVPYELVDAPAHDDGIDRGPGPDDAHLWESCLGSDPEAPEAYRLDDADLDELARREAEREATPTGRVLRALDRAAGGAR